MTVYDYLNSFAALADIKPAMKKGHSIYIKTSIDGPFERVNDVQAWPTGLWGRVVGLNHSGQIR